VLGMPPKKSELFPYGPNRRFEFHKRRQLFIRTHRETPSVAVSDSNSQLRLRGIR
jgi:hypothetical protein